MDMQPANPVPSTLSETLVDSARKSVSSVRDFAVGQIETQVAEFATKLRTTAGNLDAVTGQLRGDPFVAPLAPLVERAEAAIGNVAAYFDGRGVDRIAGDLEAFSRERPIAATVVATFVGFTISRALKASSLRRGELL